MAVLLESMMYRNLVSNKCPWLPPADYVVDRHDGCQRFMKHTCMHTHTHTPTHTHTHTLTKPGRTTLSYPLPLVHMPLSEDLLTVSVDMWMVVLADDCMATVVAAVCKKCN